MIKKVLLLSIFFIAAILTLIFFKEVKENQFIYTQDEFLVLSPYENATSFFTQNPVDLGSANTTILIVTFFDRSYYMVSNMLNLDIGTSERLLYFLKLVLVMLLPFLGLLELAKLYKVKVSDSTVFIVALWYSFNTYTLIYWHGNAFSLTLLLCYALAPLAIAYYHRALFIGKSIRDSIWFVIIAFIMTFALYFFAVFALLLLVYTLLLIATRKYSLPVVGKNLVKIIILFLPFSSILLLIAYDMFFSSTQSVNLTGGETNGNVFGGVLYQLLMWFSWAVYTHWEPRNIYTFAKYFTTIPSLLAPFLLYGLILYGAIKERKNVFLTVFILLFLLCIFFAKGPQNPLGEIYSFLLEHSFIFRIFRSPDNKFGFGVVLTVAILLVLVAKQYKQKIFIPIVAVVIFIQGYLLFTGIAIIGETSRTSSKRVFAIPITYQEASAFLNKSRYPYGYVISFPSVEVGHFSLENNITHIGQDLLPKLSHFPFIYISEYSGMLVSTHTKLANALNSSDLTGFSEFPIRYFIVRHDVKRKSVDEKLVTSIKNKYPLVFQNRDFSIYENKQLIPLIEGKNVEYEIINPVKYRVTIKNVTEKQLLGFNQNYNSNWKLYANEEPRNTCSSFSTFRNGERQCTQDNILFTFGDISYAWKRPLFESTQKIVRDYSNGWTISAEESKKALESTDFSMNADGSINLALTLYFKTQSIFYIGVLISGLYVVTLLLFLFQNKFMKDKKLYKK